MLKKVISCTVALSMMLSTNVFVFANEITENENEETIKVEFVESLDDVEIASLPEVEEISIDDLYQADDATEDIEDAPIDLNLEEGTFIEMPVAYGTERSVTQKFEGTLSEPNTFSYLLVTLAPTQIVTATLECPKSKYLNYDLFIYEVNADGTLGNIVAGSTTDTYFNTYPDGTEKTIDEGAAFINNTSTTNQYAVIVFANDAAGASAPYYLTISLDVQGVYDGAEPNDSPYTAYELEINKELTGATLHVVNDQDWFKMPDAPDYQSVSAEVTSGYKVEVYHADGNSMILNEKNDDGTYQIGRGVNYIRVFADEANFAASGYTLTLTGATLRPSQFLVFMNGDEGEKSYPDYPQGNQYLRFQKELSPKVQLLTVNNYPIVNATVNMEWESGGWSENSGRKYRDTSGVTGTDGTVELSLTTPSALGTYSCLLGGPKYFRHHYDIDTVTFYVSGNRSSTERIYYVYHFSHSEYIGG